MMKGFEKEIVFLFNQSNELWQVFHEAFGWGVGFSHRLYTRVANFQLMHNAPARRPRECLCRSPRCLEWFLYRRLVWFSPIPTACEKKQLLPRLTAGKQGSWAPRSL